jgi:DNA-binding CsgD family transcriptional regulator/tetratricopeptide (TPR) repeat protein
VDLLEREGALATLDRELAAAARGSGRVVFVSGEPGIGKSSLVAQFVAGLAPATRVLFGTCDDLTTPRPLGPIVDFGGSVSAPLERALATGAAPHEIQRLLVAELELPPRPTVVVLEDVHWADHATLDAITVLGRRIGSLPALLVLTFRDGETPAGHPFHAAVGGIPAELTAFVQLAPLSRAAVEQLSGDAGDLHSLTGGNPFYVTELLSCRDVDGLPRSISTAVVGRASRLDEPSRALLELVAVVPRRIPTVLLDELMPEWADAAEEPERRHLLEVRPAYLQFRHELARNAIRSSIPAAARRRRHAEILDALLATGADPADIVHHAEAAGRTEVVADHALAAARRAAALGANREAFSQFMRARPFLGRLPVPARAAAFEELAAAAYALGRLDEAFAAIERSIGLYEELGDASGAGRCTRVLSRFHWFAGDGAPALEKALEAIAILEPLGETTELARAYSGRSQLAMLAQDVHGAVEWGNRALELASRLGDESTRLHALVNIATARTLLDPANTDALVEAFSAADAAGEWEEAVRALANLAFTLMTWIQPGPALEYADRAAVYGEEHELPNMASYARTSRAWLLLRAGEWEEAERLARREVERGVTISQVVARTILAELAVRRGDADAGELLAEVTAQTDRAGDLQRTTPVFELTVERSLTGGLPMPTERLDRLVREIRARPSLGGWAAARIAAWAAVGGPGAGLDLRETFSPAHSAMAGRDWRAAADAFRDVGWIYDRALMLSLLDDEDALAESIQIARKLGARPLTNRVSVRMRELGMSIPRGPRRTTRTNPAGLTVRQVEVLELLAAGLTNAEIGTRLFMSPRTAEHHVAAVLAKLGARTRRDAARRAAELGVAELG